MEYELETLYVIDRSHDLFMNFKRDLFVHLQQEVLMLTDEDVAPLLLLESMLQPEFIPLSYIPSNMNLDLQRFGRKNLWHRVSKIVQQLEF